MSEVEEKFVLKKIDGGYSLEEYRGREEIVALPEEYQGESVIEIAEGAFYECNQLTELVLPSSLQKVHKRAIGPCRSLKKVYYFQELAEFDEDSFFVSEQLESLPLYVWKQLWLHRDSHEKILQTYEKDWDFFSSEEKQEILTHVSKNSFLKEYLFTKGDTELMSFLLREGVEVTLDELHDFLEATIEQNNTIATALLLHYKGEKYSKAQREAYEDHRQMVDIGLEPPTFEEFDRKWMLNQVEGGFEVIRYVGHKTEARIPSRLADGRKIFGTYHRMNGAYRPLKKIILEEGILYLDEETFSRSDSLEEIILPNSLESMGEACFYCCDALKSMVIPPKITELPQGTFSDCVSLEKVTLPEGLRAIGDYAFAMCKNLKEITLPQSLEEFKQGSRHYLDALRYTTESGVFMNSGLESITIPPKVTKITNFAFDHCSQLKEIQFHHNITELGKSAFHGAKLLADDKGFILFQGILFDYLGNEDCCVLPDSVEKISYQAFSKSNIEEVILPEGLKIIDAQAFIGCERLKKIKIPSSVAVLQEHTFDTCNVLEEVVVSPSTVVEAEALKDCPMGNIVLNPKI